MGTMIEMISSGAKRKDAVVVVSGLPRSGTSMMMRMLEAGGQSVVMDEVRKADRDNPKGYYEVERIKKLKNDSAWMEECRGKAVKVISALVCHLPENLSYRLILMEREMEEILSSQRVMLQRLGRGAPQADDKTMAEKYRAHLDKLIRWLKSVDYIRFLPVSYNAVIGDPYEGARHVNRFLGGHLDVNRMAEVVERSLYRQRREGQKTDGRGQKTEVSQEKEVEKIRR